MKSFIIFLSLSFLFVLPAPGGAAGPKDSGHKPAQASEAGPGSAPIEAGKVFPDLSLSGKISPEQAAYLGLGSQSPPVKLSQIKAPAVVLVVFSMYCPHCQREAPVLNEFQALIKERGLDAKLKFIGLGAGNSQAEVDVFRTKYSIPYPLFADPDFTVHKLIGEPGTPYFFVLTKDEKTGKFTVALSRLGRMDSPAAFLTEVAAAAKLAPAKQGDKK